VNSQEKSHKRTKKKRVSERKKETIPLPVQTGGKTQSRHKKNIKTPEKRQNEPTAGNKLNKSKKYKNIPNLI